MINHLSDRHLVDQHYGDSSIHGENCEVDPFEINEQLNVCSLAYLNRHHWSFAFHHASTSSKCILFSIQCLIQLYPLHNTWRAEWIVSEIIDWLKVRNPALIKGIFCNPDIWEEPNSGSSTTGSADHVDRRCTHEN
jgi:hypothetical protein